MSKLHITLLTVLLLALAGLTVLAVNKYEHESKGLTLVQAVAERDSARHATAVEQALNKQEQASASSQITSLSNQKAVLCAQVLKAKLVQPVCQ